MWIFVDIGKTIVYLRKQKGMTQEQSALECGISISYLRRIEHEDANPTAYELLKIATVLEVRLRNPFDVPVPAGVP